MQRPMEIPATVYQRTGFMKRLHQLLYVRFVADVGAVEANPGARVVPFFYLSCNRLRRVLPPVIR